MKKRAISLKLFCLMLSLLLLFSFAACSSGGDDSLRFGSRMPETSFFYNPLGPGWSYIDYLSDARFSVAHLRIGDHLSTKNRYHFFRAEVLDLWKGDLSGDIGLYQSGACRYDPQIGSAYPVYTAGNEVVLVLSDFRGDNDGNCYLGLHGITLGFYVVRSDGGEVYLAALHDRLGEVLSDRVPRCGDEKLLKELEENFLESDPIWEDLEYSFHYVFRYEDLKAFVQNPETDFSSHSEYRAPEVLTAPEDFDIAIEYGMGMPKQWNSVNTYENTMTKDLISDGMKTVEYEMPAELKNRIYTKLMECDLTTVTGNMYDYILSEGEKGYYMTPCTSYEIRFTLDGISFRITGDEMMAWYPNYEQARRVVFFLDTVLPALWATPEFRAMPEAVGGYM